MGELTNSVPCVCVCMVGGGGGLSLNLKGTWKAYGSWASWEGPENNSCAGMGGKLVIPLSLTYASMIITLLCFPGNSTLFFKGILFHGVSLAYEV